jgi:hypothetical protein
MEDRDVLYRIWMLIKDLPDDPDLSSRAIKVQKAILKDTGAWDRCQEECDRRANSFD